jgi:hypothetical protein
MAPSLPQLDTAVASQTSPVLGAVTNCEDFRAYVEEATDLIARLSCAGTIVISANDITKPAHAEAALRDNEVGNGVMFFFTVLRSGNGRQQT